MRSEQNVRRTMPVGLLLEGRPCLVVGGGNVATRKTGHLLEAGARIKVVGEAVTDEMEKWAKSGRLTLVKRAFRDSDVRGRFLVFAATDKTAVNHHVLACCRKRRILCNAADSNWTKGDFVTPAICRKDGLTVTVSTGGRSCRMARIVKDRLSGMLDAMAKEALGRGR